MKLLFISRNQSITIPVEFRDFAAVPKCFAFLFHLYAEETHIGFAHFDMYLTDENKGASCLLAVIVMKKVDSTIFRNYNTTALNFLSVETPEASSLWELLDLNLLVA